MDGDLFNAYTSAPDAFGAGAFQYRSAFDLSGLPGMQGGTGMLAGMGLQMFMPSILGPNYLSAPVVPFGNNLQMHYQALRFYQQRQAAMQLGAKQDEEFYFNTLRGLSNASGVKFGTQQQNAAKQLASEFATLDPLMAQMFPEMWDNLHGFKGSGAVAAMGVMGGGRMALDPITGRMGLSGQSAGLLTQGIADLYSGDAYAAMRRMHGLSMGRAGLAFEELARHGIMPEQLTPEQIKSELAKQHGVGEGDLSKALGGDQALESAMRGFNSGRTTSVIKEYSGAIKAVQEIFGDMGNPNAPMSQLFNALQAMTQGGAGRFSAEKLERVVRETYMISKMTGLGIDKMQAFTGQLSQQAMELGLDPSFGGSAARAAAMEMHAYGLSGAAAAGGWGRLSKEEYAQLAGRLNVQAAGSDQAMQLGAIVKLSEEVGFKGPGSSRAKALADAVKAGKKTYLNPATGKEESVFMPASEYAKLMSEAGIDPTLANSLRYNSAATQEMISKYDIGGTVRGGQGDIDIAPLVQNVMHGMAYSVAAKSMGSADANRIAGLIGQNAYKTFMSMDKATRGDPAKRNAAFIKAFAGLKPANMSEADFNRYLAQVAEAGWATMDQTIADTPELGGYKNMLGALDLHDPQIMAKKAYADKELKSMVDFQQALAGSSANSIVSRIAQTIADMGVLDKDQDFQDVAAKMLGGIPKGKVTEQVAAKIKELYAIQAKLGIAKQKGDDLEVKRLIEQAGEAGIDIEKLEQDMRMPTTPSDGGIGKDGAGAGGIGKGGSGIGAGSSKPGRPDPKHAYNDSQSKDDERNGKPSKMDIVGTLKIEWPNTGKMYGIGDPRSANSENA